MAIEIRISPEVMRQRSAEAQRQSDGMLELRKKMDNLLTELRGEWTGDAMDGYAYRFENIKPVLKNANELLTEIANNLNKTAEIMEQTDSQIAAQYRQ